MEKYKYVIVPLFALALGQIIKFIIESIKNKKITISRLFNGSGGMPSSHVTISWTLLFMFLFNEGLSSDHFAITLVFSLIVAYDAMVIRLESGKQAKALNKIMSKKQKNNAHLKEQLGHKPLEVLAGIILSFCVSSFYTFVIL